MAFTEGFENDIFISCTHLDNSAPGDEPGWVDRFHDELESWLARRFGHKKIAIWRDKNLRGSTLFDNRIQEVIRDSALFLALHLLDRWPGRWWNGSARCWKRKTATKKSQKTPGQEIKKAENYKKDYLRRKK